MVLLRAQSKNVKIFLDGNYRKFNEALMLHPWAGEGLSLKIDKRDQTIQLCILELKLFHSSQMKLNLAASFFKNPLDGTGHSLKCIESKD